MVSSIMLIPFELFAGNLAELIGAVSALPVLGTVLLVGSIGILLLEKPVAGTDLRSEAAD
jgi:hypothetical protein